MSGIFGKIKEKKGEWDKKREDSKVAQIQKMMDKALDSFRKNLGKGLGKLGCSLSYTGLSGADAKARMGGSMIARFNDNEGHSVTLLQSQQVYEGTPHGALAQLRKVYWPFAIWGTVVPASTPFTLLFKEVDRGFMKGTAKVFLPFTSLPFNEKELLSSPSLQTGVVAALNSDKDTCDNLAKLSLGCQISLTHKAWLNISCSDIAGKCVIVPAGEETAVFLRNYGTYGEPKLIVRAMINIRRSILAHRHSEKVTGQIPAAWITTMYAVCKAKTLDTLESPRLPTDKE
jgi:hypothetical protein